MPQTQQGSFQRSFLFFSALISLACTSSTYSNILDFNFLTTENLMLKPYWNQNNINNSCSFSSLTLFTPIWQLNDSSFNTLTTSGTLTNKELPACSNLTYDYAIFNSDNKEIRASSTIDLFNIFLKPTTSDDTFIPKPFIYSMLSIMDNESITASMIIFQIPVFTPGTPKTNFQDATTDHWNYQLFYMNVVNSIYLSDSKLASILGVLALISFLIL